MYRPFGTSVIISAYDDLHGFTLWMIEPNGESFQYFACASGKGKQTARNEIEKIDFRNLTCEEAVPRLARVLLKSSDESVEKKKELEFSWIRNATKVHETLSAEVCAKLTADALEAIENEGMND